MTRILALDQASRVSGWSIFIDGELKDWGHLTTEQDDIGDRLVAIRAFMVQKITEWNIDIVAFEDIQMQSTVGNNVHTFKTLANVYGVVYETAVESNKKVIIIPSVTWKSKLQIKGKRRPEQKKNAQIWVQETYNIKATQDECDAICIGTCAYLSLNQIEERKNHLINTHEEGYDWSN